jgi:drug/metabolite transporter (DMT)-like permease
LGKKTSPPPWWSAALALGFFLGMCAMELALEGAGKWYGHLDSLAAAVTLSQFAGCLMLPLVVASTTSGRTKTPDSRGLLRSFPFDSPQMLALYVILSLLVSGSTALATASLYYVSYTTKVAFKSAKLVPTMVVATAAGSRRYSMREYAAAALLCVGAGCFALDPGRGSQHDATDVSEGGGGGGGGVGPRLGGGQEGEGDDGDGWSQRGIGLSMLLAAVLCDALVPNAQSRLLDTKVSATQLMVNTNAVGLVLATGWMIAHGEIGEVVTAIALSPLLLGLLAVVGISLAVAVLCYTLLIESAGPVVAVSVATLRKTATIGLSYLFFPKPMTLTRAVGVAAVVVGVVLASKSSAIVSTAVAKHLCPSRAADGKHSLQPP